MTDHRILGFHDGGDGEWGVVSVERGDGARAFRRHPCAGITPCPWRRDAPTGTFPPEVFRHSARTTYDLATHTFGCHASGRDAPTTCAGFLLRGASDNLAVRMSYARYFGVHTTVELYDGYQEMAIANGVHPDDPALVLCRGDRPMEYPPAVQAGGGDG
ncbi:hypothetical protein DQ384_05065 [Sphaerisporangium album]|uniref:Uncharacterized protein n=1 Tax=Sphaerisporangium album TaxID=509200 RepID=A0A367FND6_9ACTN|nr:DUF6283 family protein [Sphaerisporangium album]RCG31916.1 hypothetical protein DQ384_05065 [Sphaerisporangium album]